MLACPRLKWYRISQLVTYQCMLSIHNSNMEEFHDNLLKWPIRWYQAVWYFWLTQGDFWTKCTICSNVMDWGFHHRPSCQLRLGVQNAGYVRALHVEKWEFFDLRALIHCQHWGGASLLGICTPWVQWGCASLGIPFVLPLLLYCGSLCPAARIMSAEVSSMLLLAPIVANRVVNLTQLSTSSDSMMSNWEGSAGNIFRSACKMAAGLWKPASEALPFP